MSNRTIPYGYRLKDGKAVIEEKEAKQIRELCAAYLSGLSFVEAAKQVGLQMYHGTVRNLLKNKRYLGTEFYPAILDRESFEAVETERQRREKMLGRTRMKRRVSEVTVHTAFKIPKVDIRFAYPLQQAEYAYSLIESEVR